MDYNIFLQDKNLYAGGGENLNRILCVIKTYLRV